MGHAPGSSGPGSHPSRVGEGVAGNAWTATGHLPGTGQGGWQHPTALPCRTWVAPRGTARNETGFASPPLNLQRPPDCHAAGTPPLLQHPCGCIPTFQEHFPLNTEQGSNLAQILQ